MSALTLILNRDGRPLQREALAAVLERLHHRGPDGSNLWLQGAAGLGVQHFWTTPEAVGETQPLHTERYAFAFDGRIDNREDLLAGLPPTTSDAALALHLFTTQGRAGVARIVGPFVVVAYDKEQHAATVMRDHLGSYSLAYHLSEHLLVVASEAHACLAHPAVDGTLNERSIIRYLALHPPAAEETMFSTVNELPPAHVLHVTPGRSTCERYWDVKLHQHVTGGSYAEQFRALLAESVRARLRATTPLTVSLSGGYDSASLTALAAQHAEPGQLHTRSWAFDHFPECDERPYIEAVTRAYNLPAGYIPCDEVWPLTDDHLWPHTPDAPSTDLYLAMKVKLFSNAVGRVLLNGYKANELFASSLYWLADLLREGKWAHALRSVYAYQRGRSLQQVVNSRRLRTSIKAVLGRRPPTQQPVPAYLTEYAHVRIGPLTPQVEGLPPSYYEAARPEHVYMVMRPLMVRGTAEERATAARFEQDIRRPFADRRLVAFMLAVPGYEVFDGSRDKRLIYEGLKDDLPASVLDTPSTGYLSARFTHNLIHDRASLTTYIEAPDAVWPQFLDRTWVQTAWHTPPEQLPARQRITLWRIASFEKWRKTHARREAHHSQKTLSYA